MLDNQWLGSKTTGLIYFSQVQFELRWTIRTIPHNTIKCKEWWHQKLPLMSHQPCVYRSFICRKPLLLPFWILLNSVQKPMQFLFLLCCASCVTNLMDPEVWTVSNLLCTQYYYMFCWSELLLHAQMWTTVIFVSKRHYHICCTCA